jgi:hypothetical protein
MPTFLPPNVFDSASIVERSAEAPAVTSVVAPSDVAAACSNSGDMDCPSDEAAATPRQSDLAAAEFCDIGEIFVGARKLNDPEARFVLDEQAFMDAIDEPPLFLRQAV